MIEITAEELLSAWPNCSVPDCGNKCAAGSVLFKGIDHQYDLTKCYPHAVYGRLVSEKQIKKDRKAGLVP